MILSLISLWRNMGLQGLEPLLMHSSLKGFTKDISRHWLDHNNTNTFLSQPLCCRFTDFLGIRPCSLIWFHPVFSCWTDGLLLLHFTQRSAFSTSLCLLWSESVGWACKHVVSLWFGFIFLCVPKCITWSSTRMSPLLIVKVGQFWDQK